MPKKKDFAAHLKSIRESVGISQNELSRRSGVPQCHISRIEAGLVSPSWEMAERLVEACGGAVVLEKNKKKS